MDERNVDVLLVHTKSNLRYVTDYYWSALADPEFILEDGSSFYTMFAGVPKDSAETPFMVPATAEKGDVEWYDPWIKDRRYWGPLFFVQGQAEQMKPHTDPIETTVGALCDRGLNEGRIAVEMRYLPEPFLARFRDLLPKAKFVDAWDLIWHLRMVKTQEEIRRIREAARANQKAMQAAFDHAWDGMSEVEMDDIIKKSLIDEGAEHHWTEMGFGPKGARMIGPTKETRLRRGEIIRIDLGCRYEGYLCDMSRLAIFGEPSRETVRAHGVIMRANEALRRAVGPGVKCSDLFRLGMKIIDEGGFSSLTPQAGHSIGRSPHEPPFLTDADKTVLEPNMIVVCEPVLRVVGVGSVNVEDMVLVTPDGNEPITTLSRELYPAGRLGHP